MLFTTLHFILALFILVTVHEYGHFQVARWCGVKVLRFSFGFGKSLMVWRDKKGTEYAWSFFPLGGYVKMLDETESEVAEAEKHLAFNRKPLGSRMAVVAAGPFLNFLLAFVLLWFAAVIGTNTLAPMVAEVEPGSIAANAGLRAGQEILAVDGKAIQSWRDFQYRMLGHIGTTSPVNLVVKSLADGSTSPIRLSMTSWHMENQDPDLLASLGIEPFIPTISPEIDTVVPHGPGEKAGLLEGDWVLQVNAKPIDDWIGFVDFVKKHPGDTVQLKVKRQGDIKIIPLSIGQKMVDGKPEGYVGLVAKKGQWPLNWLRRQQEKPLAAIGLAARQTLELSGATITLMGRLLTGKLSLGSISGPVGIAQGAGNSARGGISQYLLFLALMSISLGVLNLLPIPMLDGGHLLYYALEGIFRRPVSDKVKSAGVYVGVLFLGALMIIAFINDISRLVK